MCVCVWWSQKDYDAAVGDITITANRSSYVDFALPFAEGGVSMIVPIKYKDTDSIWTFLKPMNMKLWLTSIAFFILTGYAVWVLEHRIDSAFSGRLSHHVGLILWFPLSGIFRKHKTGFNCCHIPVYKLWEMMLQRPHLVSHFNTLIFHHNKQSSTATSSCGPMYIL